MFGSGSKRWHLFTWSDHKIYLEPWFLLLVAFFVFSGLNSAADLPYNLMWAPVLFGGVLLHELGHAVTTKAFGYGGSTIILQGFGGVAINSKRGRNTPGEAILISLAGPGASLALAIISFVALYLFEGSIGLAPPASVLGYLFWLSGSANLFWAVFNMLPVNPMDGGHVVLHGLRFFVPERKAMLWSAYSSLALIGLAGLFVLFVLGVGSGTIILVILIVLFGMQNWQIIKQLS